MNALNYHLAQIVFYNRKNLILFGFFLSITFYSTAGGAVCIYQNSDGDVICTLYGSSGVPSEAACAASARASNPECGLPVGAINVAAGSCASAIFGSPNRCLDNVAPHDITASVTQVACEAAGDRWCPSTYYGFFAGNSGCQDAICASAQNIILLPVEIVSFQGQIEGHDNQLSWTTESEQNNDYFQLEHSLDGVNWTVLAKISGAGNSTETQNYRVIHTTPDEVVNYYTLHQIDYDGEIETFTTISIDNRTFKPNVLKVINSMGQTVDEYYKGFVIICYDDGTFQKTYR